MAAGDETEVFDSTFVNHQTGRVTISVNVLIERKDGSLLNIGQKTYEKDYDAPTLETKSVATLKAEVKVAPKDASAEAVI